MFASWKGTGKLLLRVAFRSERVDVLLRLLVDARIISLDATRADPMEPVGVLTARDAHLHFKM